MIKTRLACISSLGLVLALVTAVHSTTKQLHPRVDDDSTWYYIETMCFPYFSNASWWGEGESTWERRKNLAASPFPCEQGDYISRACVANGTTEIDFLAEQQCLCNGAYFEVVMGCNQCLLSHGWERPGRSAEVLAENLSWFSSAECSATPILRPYRSIVNTDTTYTSFPPLKTLLNDRFPNDTAVSNYFTPTTTNLLGEITGSATARVTTHVKTTRSKDSTTALTTSSVLLNSQSNATSVVSTASSGNAGGKSEARVTAGVLAAALGIVALL
ncbi:hypothetical protein GLAREA_08728 [Glarea lozoyensis ATCC 20868]|uniref:Uncharacterized protein n=1 Tax=Glarea lozoyensis (strain ATCC 20868 / MF5171) TaxID=1116229 RepID=S3DFN6_GLAL2|nr:uncharacterized protein GLAREA_08728 [Glarea lozoyensis ATCC 20868]EPE36565.1 hypothetical protein GLAREA_08728 [Glarea lozoyensis ATCC 20868]